MNSLPAKVVLRMGAHSEKEYVENTLRFFDGFILGSNLIEATPAASTSLVVKLCTKKKSIPFYIDPMTYAFGAVEDSIETQFDDLDWIMSDQKVPGQQNTIRAVRRSYKKLAKALGGVFQIAVDKKTAIQASDFQALPIIKECCKSLVTYQMERLQNELEDEVLEEVRRSMPAPAAIFTPYFYNRPKDIRKWRPIVWSFAEETVEATRKKYSDRIPVHSVISTSGRCLQEGYSDDLRKTLIGLCRLGIRGIWLWFSDFREEEVTDQQLIAYASIVSEISNAGLEVYNLHGGFLGLALSKYGLTGISHGIGYGEQKAVMPVLGQSVPWVNYYLPDVKRKLGVPEIQLGFGPLGIKTAADFFDQICNCVMCKGVLKDTLSQFDRFGDTHFSNIDAKKKVQTPAAAKRCRFHYLLSRIGERDFVKGATTSEIADRLLASFKTWSDILPDPQKCAHLKTWGEFLDK